MGALTFQNLDSLIAFKALKEHKEVVSLREDLTPERVREYTVKMGGGLNYNYAAKYVNESLLNILQDVSDEQELIKKYQALLSGEVMNTGENRLVLHQLSRGECFGPVVHKGENIGEFYRIQLHRVADFAGAVQRGKITGSSGKPFTTVVQIGIGGSDLGPRALYLALKNSLNRKPYLEARFISNVDPDDPNDVLEDIDFASSLFILVSKSGTTQETLTNRQFVMEKMKDAGIEDPSKHMIAVTGETSPLAESPEYLDSFYIDDFIGGRYSSTSAVGGAVLSIALGADVFNELLEGAHEADLAALEPDIRKNPSLLDALIGMYERNVLEFSSTAILPYSQALSRFPAHLQQLDMESNGKRVNRVGGALHYSTGPVIFGEPGTNGQHSFYQLLHQGTDIIPLQFIGFQESQSGFDLTTEGSTSQVKLNANLAAQIAAFTKGKNDENRNKVFPGERPSSLIYGQRLSARSMGALLAHFENKVMFQGFIWNVNSFDQEGVQLGKLLTKKILSGETLDSALEVFSGLLKVR